MMKKHLDRRCSAARFHHQSALQLEALEERRLLAGDLAIDGDVPPELTPIPVIADDDVAEGEDAPDLVAFAQALADAGTTFFGAEWCPACTAQKQLFEDGAKFLPFVEVTNPDHTINSVGQQNGITQFPTWQFPDQTRVVGQMSLDDLAQRSGISMIPTSSQPFLSPIDDMTLLAGSPLHLALDGYDPNGDDLTYTITSDNAAVDVRTLSGNRSVRFQTSGYGDIVIETFEQRAKRATDVVLGLADAGTYDNTIFHRVIDGFVIQGGDPTGTGFGDPNLPDFDDVFHYELQHNRDDLASFAKSGDDTNSSQFFLTDGATRHLDFNHSIWGLIVEGTDVREAISRVPTNSADRPTPFTVTLQQATTFVDNENAVAVLSADEGTTGDAEITVVATDTEGNQFTRQFTVTIIADTVDGEPFLSDISNLNMAEDTTETITLEATDVESDNVQFGVFPNSDFTFTLGNQPVNASNMLAATTLQITPNQGFTGTAEITVFSHDPSTPIDPNTTTPQQIASIADVQTFQVTVSEPGTVNGITFDDTNRDGVQNNAEVGVAGFTVFADANDNGLLDSGEVFTTSGGGGSYSLQLLPGQHEIRLRQLPHMLLTNNPASQTVTVTEGQTTTDIHLGSFEVLAPTVDLLPATDTGLHDDDDITSVNNNGGGRFEFEVSGVEVGAQVEIFASGISIGQATANANTVTITTTGVALSDGAQVVVATQTVDSVISPISSSLGVTIDSMIDPISSTAPTDAAVGADLAYDAEHPEEGNTDFRFALTTAPTGAQIDAQTGVVTWVPDENQLGAHDLTVTATDAAGNSVEQSFSVTVDVNIAVNDDSFTIVEDSGEQTLDVLSNDVRLPAGDRNIISTTTPTDGGLLTISGDAQSLLYTPAANFFGIERFDYTVRDVETGQEQTGQVTMIVTAQNDPPTVGTDQLSVTKNTSDNALNVLLNDSSNPDDAETLTITAVSQPQNGTVSLSANAISYTPNAEFTGDDSFTYTVSDGNGGESEGTVNVTVLDFVRSSLSGTVYVDVNNDGILNDTEEVIGGVEIRLTGTNTLGENVNLTIETGPDGNYEFTELAPGSYTLTQQQPDFLIDGIDSIGSQGGATSDDRFVIDLPEDTVGINNNFGERGRMPQYITLLDLLASSAQTPLTTATNADGQTEWYIGKGDWQSTEVTSVDYVEQAVTIDIVENNTTNLQATLDTSVVDPIEHLGNMADGTSLLRVPFAKNELHFATPPSGEGAAAEGESLEDLGEGEQGPTEGNGANTDELVGDESLALTLGYSTTAEHYDAHEDAFAEVDDLLPSLDELLNLN